MAVQFAIGIITGTVLSFEFGLLWPGMMGRWGDVFGLGFGVEAWAFFLEAVLIAIYLYGWRRLKPWTHFWLGRTAAAGRPDGGVRHHRGQLLDEHAPGVQPRRPGQADPRRRAAGDLHTDVRPGVLALRGRDASDRRIRGRRRVRGRLAARAPRPLPPARLHRAFHGRRDPHTGPVHARRLRRSRPSSTSSRSSSPPWRSSGRPTPTYRSTCSDACNRDGTVSGGIKIPQLDSILAGFSPDTKVTGLTSVPASRPPDGDSGHHRPLGLRHHGHHRQPC